MKQRFSLLSTSSALLWLAVAAVSHPALAFDIHEGEVAGSGAASRASNVRPPMVNAYRGYSQGPFSPPPIAFTPLNQVSDQPVAAAPVQAPAVVSYPPIAFAPLEPAAPAPLVYPQIAFAPLTAPAAAQPLTGGDFNPLAVPAAPVASSSGARVAFPPVDPAVAARAQSHLQAGHIAAVPTVVSAPASVGNVRPVDPLYPSAASGEALSRNTKSILGSIPSKMDTEKPGKTEKVKLNRTSPTLDALDLKNAKKVDAYEAAGIKISVRRPGLDTNYELNRAYNALSGGDSAAAMQVYKNILSVEPVNQDALFGLASLYHRQGDIARARPLYGVLLKNYPTHREGINNFLVLVSDEAPQEALAELERLEQRNPDFSPIPAQQALVLDKLGYIAEAQAKMTRAIELAPDNLTYKYNLAIMLDRQGNYPQAAALYRTLIDSGSKGAIIPAPIDAIQRRLNFISVGGITPPLQS